MPKMLVIGGTRFVGRQIVDAALSKGFDVTVFHRGQTGLDLFEGRIRHMLGDRNCDLHLAGQESWDFVVDTCGYKPRELHESVTHLQDKTGRYLFISTISVYKDPDVGGDESSELFDPEGIDLEEFSFETYGALKVACERVVQSAWGERATVVRPGLVIGPQDHSDRFTYWPVRIHQGGRVLVPDRLDQWLQVIDGRDLASFVVRLLLDDVGSAFHATGPDPATTLGEVLNLCKSAVGAPDTTFELVSPKFLEDQGVQPWSDLPLYVGAGDRDDHSLAMSVAHARAHGLTCRPLAETIRDTLEFRMPSIESTPLKVGLTPEREHEVLQAWDAAQLSMR